MKAVHGLQVSRVRDSVAVPLELAAVFAVELLRPGGCVPALE